MIKVSEITALAAQVEALSQKIYNLSIQKLARVMACDTCGREHILTNCSIVKATHRPIEQLDFVGSAL